MLIPKRVKYRKMHRGRRQGIATRGATVAFGDYGLQAMEACWMSNRQIEAARRAMTRHVKRGGQIWIRVFPDKSITKKPAETRMGSGKGNPEGWVAVIKPGRVLFEMGGVTPQVAKEADELGMRLRTARRELYELRFKHAVGQLENSSQISKVRHDLARIMTVLRERDFGVQPLEALPEATAVAVQEPAAEEEAPKPKRGRKKKE